MIKDNINNMIMSAMKDKQTDKANVYRLIKNEFLKYTTAKNAKPLDDAAEINILQKMVKQREESINNYKMANRQELAEAEQKEINIINELLPQTVSKEVIEEYVQYWYPNGIQKKDMGKIIKQKCTKKVY
jgi:uncharacterized protein YqeY